MHELAPAPVKTAEPARPAADRAIATSGACNAKVMLQVAQGMMTAGHDRSHQNGVSVGDRFATPQGTSRAGFAGRHMDAPKPRPAVTAGRLCANQGDPGDPGESTKAGAVCAGLRKPTRVPAPAPHGKSRHQRPRSRGTGMALASAPDPICTDTRRSPTGEWITR